MIDLHNHILPGIDDGAHDLEEALTMARQAVGVGTTVMAATPHRFAYGHEITASIVFEHVEELQRNLDEHQIPLRIVPGIELGMRPDLAEALANGTVMPLGGRDGKYALIEPPFDRIPGTALPALESVLALGLTPILAHPERNAEVQDHLAFLETCAALGVFIQITAGSIVGKFGERAQKAAQKIALQRDWKIIIASDAHDQHERTPSDMPEAVSLVAKWIGDAKAARAMVEDVPLSLIG
jgi:protein-tyrosine phosphatase